ncbi:dTDP-4-amino-4,6-dideoxygalactose transaminase [Mesohalobacter halotolerans]|uniref:dTDP-4-amino-4,6-dideoxygalactose transaminase n=1 Tax=Mesohalobacter halotolerans TaxID=1883405 RepID=A0A4U5TRT9_9FLAO|nr:dTDP-4-amino-4,6-dideoxygalactose transaminase [Mesohalobacter halotolerans]TKS56989.1 dTDP-4-amino-4,6-dideoxygalactose transaminase [Mesohalobacter halotolerans]
MAIIPFNKPYISGNEFKYISESVESGKISGDGIFTKKCHTFFEETYEFKKVLLTTSCTDALEMAAILIDIKPGDEVIMPSYTFVSTANAFALRGAKIVFADSRKDHPGMDENSLEALITSKTKAIVPVHYAGVACDMDIIMDIADRHNLFVVEDAAQAIDSYYKGKPLGGIGHLAAFSFHETKNIISGEGGMLVINDESFAKRAEIIREKGTNRSSFFRGEVDKYGWVDLGSSFLPSDMIAAFLYSQLENLQKIQSTRKKIWDKYDASFRGVLDKNKGVRLPVIPDFATNNAHMYYLTCASPEERNTLLSHLKGKGILAVFHYLSLHKSRFFEGKYNGLNLTETDKYTDCLVRLPLFFELDLNKQKYIIDSIHEFYS